MSLNVLIIAEDIRYDQYMIAPIIRGMMKCLNQPTAKVRCCQDPRFRGYAQATDWGRLLSRVFGRYQQVDAFVLCVDRDGETGRDDALRALETKAEQVGIRLFATAAHQELEAWVLAGCKDFKPADYSFEGWQDVRAERDVKERAFEPYAVASGASQGPGGGRMRLGEEAGRLYASRVRRKCPELQQLEDRVQAWLATRSG
ncbi:MAG: hypothetical protein AAGJ10_10445 [Bacteroidota bacterium]